MDIHGIDLTLRLGLAYHDKANQGNFSNIHALRSYDQVKGNTLVQTGHMGPEVTNFCDFASQKQQPFPKFDQSNNEKHSGYKQVFPKSSIFHHPGSLGMKNIVCIDSGPSQEKREKKDGVRKRSCKMCGVVNTPIWRKGPDGPHFMQCVWAALFASVEKGRQQKR
ncbi:unnamed protein product [Ilex paraguariensis]|uniref:GATA-type domain-containing protein n=1 Tax=Ilex paraguariensis TaxID=185542 RepID=A0ABC8TF03_9AQUA